MKKTSFLTILCVLTTVNSAAIAATSLSSTSANSSAVGAVLRAGSLRNVPAKVNSNRETVSTNEKSDSERMSTLVGFSLGKYNTNTGTGSGNSGSVGNTNSAALNNLTNNVEKLTAEIGNLNLKVAGIEDSSVDIKIAADQAQTKAEDAKAKADVANTIATEARETAANAATAADTAQTAATNAKNIAETVSATFSPDAINGIKDDVQKASIVAAEAKVDVKNVHEELSAKMADKISKSEVVDVVRPVFYDKDETNILLKTKVGIDELNKKADADKVEYALQEINTNLSKKIDADKVPDMSNLYTKDKVYTKEEIAAFLANKADKGEGNGDIGGLENRIGALEIANFASKDYVDGKTDGKADKNGVYTKDEITAFLANKADKGAQNEDITNLVGRIGALENANFASKDYVDKQNNGKADKDGVYSKEEMNQRFKGYATLDALKDKADSKDVNEAIAAARDAATADATAAANAATNAALGDYVKSTD
ncbi:MAG: hypothetical protein K5912_04570, partial [Alphaproteobacteria bacterium]|nr:hypothetical protein [Alphaproteobacteria bacterium]